LGGQKLGNLIFVALADIYKGDLNRALEEFSKIISTKGRVLPATLGDVNIWAKTKKGKKIYGEENIDLGRYNGGGILTEVHLNPPNVKTYQHTLDSLLKADFIIVGPGDLFSTVLPVIIVPKIKNILKSAKVPKIFIVNIANKPFETPNFAVLDYLQVIKKHLGADVFDKILVNVNQKYKIPKGLKYKYVPVTQKTLYYTMLHRADSGESIGFFESQWFEYAKAYKKLTLKREKEVISIANKTLKEWRKRRRGRAKKINIEE
ncbi:MAG: hypothetical protein UT06_C0049G0001, partial [Candidatus Woesebacteria bacterium GW2011_GWA1_38_8]